MRFVSLFLFVGIIQALPSILHLQRNHLSQGYRVPLGADQVRKRLHASHFLLNMSPCPGLDCLTGLPFQDGGYKL